MEWKLIKTKKDFETLDENEKGIVLLFLDAISGEQVDWEGVSYFGRLLLERGILIPPMCQYGNQIFEGIFEMYNPFRADTLFEWAAKLIKGKEL